MSAGDSRSGGVAASRRYRTLRLGNLQVYFHIHHEERVGLLRSSRTFRVRLVGDGRRPYKDGQDAEMKHGEFLGI